MNRRSRIVNFLVILVLFVITFENYASASPCGICGVDVICKEKFPLCSNTNRKAIMLDSCGCCLVCKKILEKDESCFSDVEQYEICKAGLECVNNKCTEVKPSNR